MSENDSGSGRKGFVRDVMRRISPTGAGADDPTSPETEATPEASEPPSAGSRAPQGSAHDLHDAIRFFGSDSGEFRRRLDRVLSDFDTLRRRYDSTRDQLQDAERQNEKLVTILQESRLLLK